MSSRDLRRGSAALLGLLFLALSVSAPAQIRAQGRTLVVDSELDAVDASPGDGRCATAGGSCTLRAAVQEANALTGADRIELPAGHYALTRAGADEDMAASGDLDIRGDLRLVGLGGRDATVIASEVEDRVLHLPCYAKVHLEGLTIRDGRERQGAGIYSEGELTIVGSRIRENVTDADGSGGGIFNDRGILRLGSTEVLSNEAGYEGGGIDNREGDVEILGSRIEGNAAGYSGGALNSGGWGGDAVLVGDSNLVANRTGDGEDHAAGIAIGSWGESALRVVDSRFYDHENTALDVGSNGHTTARLDGVTIRDNRSAADGAALRAGSHGTTIVEMRGSSIEGNHSQADGGAISAGSHGTTTLRIHDSRIEDNRSDSSGGAIELGSHGLTIMEVVSSTISGNTAAFSGGAMEVGSHGETRLRIAGSALHGNLAGQSGGAIQTSLSASIEIDDSTLSDNRAQDSGGAISLAGRDGAVVQLTHATLYANRAPNGAGLFLASGRGGATTLAQVANSVIAGSIDGPGCAGDAIQSSGGNLDGDGSCGFARASDLDGVDPLLGPLTDNGGPSLSHAPSAGSPLIDAAERIFCSATDQRGAARPFGVGCDIGAVEQAATVPDAPPARDPSPVQIPVVERHERWERAPRCEAGSVPPEPGPTASATRPAPTPQPSPTAEPTDTPEVSEPAICVCQAVRREVPAARIAAVLADPDSVDGWQQPLDPGKPAGPFNPPRECLSIRNPALRYEPVFNPLIWRVGCP